VDFKKAFYTVRHQHLWDRLDAYGVKGHIQDCVCSLYAQPQVAVSVNGERSGLCLGAGGRQARHPLCPTLFGMLIEVLQQYIKRALGLDWQDRVP
jgi:hypothetical protein